MSVVIHPRRSCLRWLTTAAPGAVRAGSREGITADRRSAASLADEKGNVGMIFAMMIVPTILCLGMALDFGRAYSLETKMQETADSAVLAAGRAYDSSGNQQTAIAAGTTLFNQQMAANQEVKLDSLTMDDKGNVHLNASAQVNTGFLRIANKKKLDVKVHSSSLTSDQGGKDLELAIVFDVTGSMDWNSKINTAKTAAHQLVDILMPAGVTQTRSVRISLVPFSQTAKLPSSLVQAATGVAPVTSSTTMQWQQQQQQVCTKYQKDGVTCKKWEWQDVWVQVPVTTYTYNMGCMVERMNTANGGADSRAYGDDPPGAGAYFHAFTSSSSSANCIPTNEIVPLTTNRTAILNTVDSLSANGGTAGHIGTAWGWYTVSPRWAGFWPNGSTPAPRDDAKLLKAVIIMTDGDFNLHYNTSWQTVSEDYSNNPSIANGRSRFQAGSICTQMKATGVEVFAVGVELDNQTARDTLSNCVSAPSNLFERHYYDVANNLASQDGLVAAFTEIGHKIASATGTGNARVRLTR